MSDYRREYGVSADELGGMPLAEFMWLLQGLSDRSRFTRAWTDAPKHMHDPADRAALIAAARR